MGVQILSGRFQDGSAAIPAKTYILNPTLGQYRIGSNNEGFSAGGTLRWDYDSTRLNLSSGYGLGCNGDVGTSGKVLIGGSGPSWSANPTLTTVTLGAGAIGAPSLAFGSGFGWYAPAGNVLSAVVGSARIFDVGPTYASANGDFFVGTSNVLITSDAAHTLAQRNGTNAQVSRFYETYTDASNYARLSFITRAGSYLIGSESAGSGTVRALEFIIGGATTFQITTSGNFVDQGTHTIQAGSSIKSIGATAGVGYGTGAGGAITQITSRTTGVTLNTVTGDITLFSAAGSATAASFTVTNSAVVATDNIVINQKSGTNLYNTIVTTVAAGSFVVTFYTTGGTAVDAPVFHFSVIKGVSS